MQQIIVTDHTGESRAIPLKPDNGLSVAQYVYTSGTFCAPALCSGLARCGRCRMLFTENTPLPRGEDALYFTEAELREGWRLGCHHTPEAGMCITLPELPSRKRPLQVTSQTLAAAQGKQLKMAVDIGTTSLHWSLLEGDKRIAHGQELNPQMGAGSEVMSRLAFARNGNGAETLQTLLTDRLHDIVTRTADAGASISECCVAANSVMTYLLLGKATSGLASAPYALDYKGGSTETLDGLPPMYMPPLPSPFVGGDLSAGMQAVLERNPEYPFLLADLGTNGEFVLALSPDKALVTSVALGPALEGIGLTFGTVAQPGVITRYSMTPKGLKGMPLPQEPDGPPAVKGISGTGYLSLVHALLKGGLLDRDGRFAEPPYNPLATRLAAQLNTQYGEKRYQLQDDMYLLASDVEELLKVKAAFTLAYEHLLAKAGLATSDIRTLYVAGALGEHADIADLEGLGFIPAGMGARVSSLGNSSLRGAELFLIDPARRGMAEVWTAAAEHVDLTTDPAFTQNFTRHMRFIFS
ncbi:ASKHA domain-containing protein [Desulfovibrio mangrovi]|uniref:ASKHA domain-containing protein n=1 Tax=Desulfovibrio mangrovi TaxID=2976983 RepID=UPI002246FDB1|nr:ASKHA domain-containing protein [Desulfovibrio mangrovi]UZP69059.1 ASKHA domain-containing protein [Desulfovibrio mangrovi]